MSPDIYDDMCAPKLAPNAKFSEVKQRSWGFSADNRDTYGE